MYSGFTSQNRNDQNHKKALKSNFEQAQRAFDKKFRFYKRQHKSKDMQNLEFNAEQNPNEM